MQLTTPILLAALGCAAASSCSKPASPSPSQGQSPSPIAANEQKPTATPVDWPPFAIRGRWNDSRALRYRIEDATGPLPHADFTAAMERAIAQWNASGSVKLTRTNDEAAADITLAWRRGRHGACEPFGPSGAVAHTGPVGAATYVHFDADRAWTGDGATATSLHATALHELGHALGLGHVATQGSVMHSEPERPTAPADSDLAGLQSLYGGGDDDASDLRILAADGVSTRAVLRRVAPKDRTAFCAFDTDGDGKDEILVWRTDAAGHGALMVYGFGPGPSLVRTLGPFLGAVAPGATTSAMLTDHGERLLVSTLPNGRRTACAFDDLGSVEAYAGEPPQPAAKAAKPDFDGDGNHEMVERVGG